MAAAPSAQARVTLQDAFERFASTVAPDDKRLFHNTQLKDVRDEAIRIERQLRARRTQRCMARLDNFLRGMEHYSKVVEVLCNGTPFLPWIWAPVKLMLMITADSISAFEKLTEAYGKIGDIVSRLDRLGYALVNDHNFQNVLALVYSDIVEFHRRAYKFVKRKSWSIFFSSMWAGFESRFNGILKNLAYHTELADKEAAAADIAESVRRSKADDENWEQQEREWTAVKIQKVLAWLGTTDILPADLLDRHLRDYLPHSCDWFIQHKATDLWLGDSAKNPLLWLCGKPGAGKSMICSALVQHTETNAVHVFYYFCSFLGSRSDGPSRLLRSLISQVIQKHQDLAIYVHDVYFKSNPEPTKKALLTLLPELLRGLGSVRLIVDGIDEWASRDQKELLNDLSQMISTDQSSHICKILVASRDTIATSRRKKDKLSTMISLSNGDEGLAVTRAIARFVNDKLSDLPEHFEELDPDSSIMAHVKKTLLEKSQGMFLWVSLVLESFDTVYSPEELRTIVDNLPSDLEALYAQIVTRLCSAPGAQNYGGVPRIMSWICFSRRPLHKSELLQALSMFPDDMGSQMRSIPVASILDHCKPLIEELPDSTIVPVHFSVKEYLLKAQIPQIVPATDVALDISCACAIVIIRGLELVRLGSNSTDYLTLIASGTYRLLPYAIEFWIEHCLQYASGEDIRPGRPLQRHLDRLHKTHEDYLHAVGLGRNQNVSPDWAKTTHAEERLSLFLNRPIFGLMSDVLSLQHLVSQLDGDNSSDIETYVIDNDRTLFSKLAHTYESAVVYLLTQREVQGITPTTLRAFQESYASTAFRCRYPHCERLSSGFATAQLRLEHETAHVQRVYCQTVSCQYHRIGFVKRSALSAHMRKHHGQSNVLLIPAKIRRITHAESKPEEPRQNSQSPSMDLPQSDRIAAAEQLLRSSPGIIRYMDSERFPPDLLNAQIRQNLAPGVMSWAQLKAWAQRNPTHALGLDTQRITMLQVLHHQDREREQQKSGGGEGTQAPPNLQDPPTRQTYSHDQIINQFAKKLMDTAKPEIMEKFKSEVDQWREDKKQQLLAQGIQPLFLRFRQHADMVYRKGALDKPAAVKTGAQIDTPQKIASNDVLGEGLDSDAIAEPQVEPTSLAPSEAYRQDNANEAANTHFLQDYRRAPSETYADVSAAHAASYNQPEITPRDVDDFLRDSNRHPLEKYADVYAAHASSYNQPEITLSDVHPLLSPYRRPYAAVQDIFEEDQPAPLSTMLTDINSNDYPSSFGHGQNFDNAADVLDSSDFDYLLDTGDNDYDEYGHAPAALHSQSQSPATYGHTSLRPPGVNTAGAELDSQQQRIPYKMQLDLLERQNKKRLLPSRQEEDYLAYGQPMQQLQKAPYETQQTELQTNERYRALFDQPVQQQFQDTAAQQIFDQKLLNDYLESQKQDYSSSPGYTNAQHASPPSARADSERMRHATKGLIKGAPLSSRSENTAPSPQLSVNNTAPSGTQERLPSTMTPWDPLRQPLSRQKTPLSSDYYPGEGISSVHGSSTSAYTGLLGDGNDWSTEPSLPKPDTQPLYPAQRQQRPPPSSVGELQDIPLHPDLEDRWMSSGYRSPHLDEAFKTDIDWEAWDDAARDYLVYEKAPQERYTSESHGTPRSTTGTGGIARNIFNWKSPSPKRDDSLDVGGPDTYQLPDPAQAHGKLPSVAGTPASRYSSWLEDPRPVDSLKESPGPTTLTSRGPYYY